jgi:hypothetical protein
MLTASPARAFVRFGHSVNSDGWTPLGELLNHLARVSIPTGSKAL